MSVMTTTQGKRKLGWRKAQLYAALLVGAIFAGAQCSGCSPARSSRMLTFSNTLQS